MTFCPHCGESALLSLQICFFLFLHQPQTPSYSYPFLLSSNSASHKSTSNLMKVLIHLCIVLFLVPITTSTVLNCTNNICPAPPLSINGTTYTYVCDPARYRSLGLDMAQFPFCNKSLPYNVRVRDLIDRMELEEKAFQLSNDAYGVARLGLPLYQWWNEALHGVARKHGVTFDSEVPGATSFPQVILTAATFDQPLWKNIAQVVSTEARAMYNLGHAGLTFWTPNINIVRDPRWGRSQETPGEDPLVAGLYGTNFVSGLQEVEGTEDITDLTEKPLKVSGCCKHYVAHDLDAWTQSDGTIIDRYHFDAKVTGQDMVETYVPAFEMCVKEGQASSVMCSYNAVNGIPVCADQRLLNQTLRGKWNFHGYIVSDCDAVIEISRAHHYLNSTPTEAVAQSIKAGLDVNCGGSARKLARSAVSKGLISEDDVDRSLTNNYNLLLRLGYFDGIPSLQSLGKKDICTNEHIELAVQAAREGIVLLKNQDKALPLDPRKFKSLAVIGQHANNTEVVLGNYYGMPCKNITVVEAFSAFANVKYRMGCLNVLCESDEYIAESVEIAKEADATVLVVGLDLTVEREKQDRLDLLLPGHQTELVNQVTSASKGPVILILMCGGGVDITFAKNNPKIGAILWAGYPGAEGARSISDVVFGKHNPGGRLPLTWYEDNYIQKLPMTSMQMRPDERLGYPGRTYKFYNGPVVYPFGYGLSYTNFTYKLASSSLSSNKLVIKLNKYQNCRAINNKNINKAECEAVGIDELPCKEDFKVEIEVQNVGEMDGSEVVIVYSKPPVGIGRTHRKQVIGFKRTSVGAGKSEMVEFTFNYCKALGIVNQRGYKLLPSGLHTIIIGDSGLTFPLNVQFHKL